MARKVQITKEKILSAALKILIRDGYSAINIKSLALELGCSTQPVVWQFQNMEGLRKALAEYALSYANEKMYSRSNHEVEAFESVGRMYVRIALYEPNLFRFLYLDEDKSVSTANLSAILKTDHNAQFIAKISNQLGISKEGIARYLQNTIIYSHGIATLVATNAINASEDEMMKMINNAANAFLQQEGVPVDLIKENRMRDMQKKNDKGVV